MTTSKDDTGKKLDDVLSRLLGNSPKKPAADAKGQQETGTDKSQDNKKGQSK